MEALFELIKSLLYIIVFIPYYFIAFGVVMYALILCLLIVREPIKRFFDRHYYGENSDQISYAAGPWFILACAVLISFIIIVVLLYIFALLLGEVLIFILFVIGVCLLYKKFKSGFK